jgi:excisionase family DNA binding protein
LKDTLPTKTEYALSTKLQGGHDLKKSIYTSYDELPLLLNVKQLVDLMGVSDSSVYELIQEADFPSLRIGKRIVVPKEDLRKWITAHTKGASGC